MTGYGRARQTLGKRDSTGEGRAVNNRYLDCAVKLPRAYAFAEDAVRKHVQQAVSRGKVDVLFTIDSTGADTAKIVVDRGLAEGYAAALRELDDPGIHQVYARCPVGGGVAYAVQNRLKKAAAFHIVDAEEEA